VINILNAVPSSCGSVEAARGAKPAGRLLLSNGEGRCCVFVCIRAAGQTPLYTPLLLAALHFAVLAFLSSAKVWSAMLQHVPGSSPVRSALLWLAWGRLQPEQMVVISAF
jgi:hypothetical protein